MKAENNHSEKSPGQSGYGQAALAAKSVRHTQIKICGFTRVVDAVAACEAGVDAVGLVFYPPSSRNVDVRLAAEIAAALPPFVTITGLFLNAEQSLIDKVLRKVPLSLLQFHGNETPQFCADFARPYIKSVAMKSIADVTGYASSFTTPNSEARSEKQMPGGVSEIKAQGFLLDSNVSGGAGGSGETFDWNKIPTNFPAPLILAGGLDCSNVEEAVRKVKPAAVDVSSGVESAKGIKDPALMQKFIQCVRAADSAIIQACAGDQ